VGTVSNRSAIGAKIRVQATIAGTERWQLRQISGGDGENNSDSLIGHFGLGDATVIETLRVEWPAGAMQAFKTVAANQTLRIFEPPGLTAIQSDAGSGFTLKLIGGVGFSYGIEASTNLVNWDPLITLTNSTRTIQWTDAGTTNFDQRFYRAAQIVF